MSLRKKIFLGIMLVFLIITVLTGFFMVNYQSNLLNDQFESRGAILAGTLAQISREAYSVYQFSGLLTPLERNIESIEVEQDVRGVRIIDLENRIITDNKNQQGEHLNSNLEKGSYKENDYLISRHPITIGEEIVAFAEVDLSLENIQEKISDMLKIIILVFMLTIILTMFIVNAILSHFLKPIEFLSASLRKLPKEEVSLDELNSIRNNISTKEIEELYESIIFMFNKLKEMQKSLIEKTELAAIGKMSTYIAHEIRNPLEAISGSAEVVKMYIDQDKIQYIDIIKEEITVLNEFLNDFLSLGRKKEMKLEKMEINKLIEEILNLIDPMCGKKNIKVESNLAGQKLFTRGSIKDLKSVFTNIIINSIEEIKQEGIIKVDSFKIDNYINVSIIDNGKGIKNEDLEKIFSPFYSTKKNGSGIGLSLSKGIIEKHGGEIIVKSQKNRWSKFIIKLPVFEEEIINGKNINY